MITKGLIVSLDAKPGKELEVAEFLRAARPLVDDEPDTVAWIAFRTGERSFAIVDAFPDQAGRQAHLEGAVAAALGARADELLACAPAIDPVDVVSAKLPDGQSG
jgi:quinol monooxygenase YgiN